MAEKKENTTQLVAVLAVVLVVLGVVYGGKLFGSKSKAVNTTRGGVGGVGGTAGGGGGGGPQITVTPDMIPNLSPEIKRKVKEKRGSDATIYPKEKLEAGVNMFIPFDKNLEDIEQRREAGDAAGGPADKKKKAPAFNKKLTFWGAFSPGPDDPKRAIIEVAGEPQPWTGVIGEHVEGTPYELTKIGERDLYVELTNPNNRRELVRLKFEGLKDDGGAALKGDAEFNSLFGGTPKAGQTDEAAGRRRAEFESVFGGKAKGRPGVEGADSQGPAPAGIPPGGKPPAGGLDPAFEQGR